jgi:hypothetical protein
MIELTDLVYSGAESIKINPTTHEIWVKNEGLTMAFLEVPSELKSFHKLFEKLAYSHDWSRVFDDFLDYIISYNSLVPEKLESFSYSKSELKLFWELYQEWIKVMDQQLVTDNDCLMHWDCTMNQSSYLI